MNPNLQSNDFQVSTIEAQIIARNKLSQSDESSDSRTQTPDFTDQNLQLARQLNANYQELLHLTVKFNQSLEQLKNMISGKI